MDFLLTPHPPLLVHVVIEWPLRSCHSIVAFANDFVDEGVADQHHGPQAVGGGVEVQNSSRSSWTRAGSSSWARLWRRRLRRHWLEIQILFSPVDARRYLGQIKNSRQELKWENLGKLTRSYLCVQQFDKFLNVKFIHPPETEVLKVVLKNSWNHSIKKHYIFLAVFNHLKLLCVGTYVAEAAGFGLRQTDARSLQLTLCLTQLRHSSTSFHLCGSRAADRISITKSNGILVLLQTWPLWRLITSGFFKLLFVTCVFESFWVIQFIW